ncbi:hypothetical protein D9M70_474450 [compost metagenome]
MRVESHAVGQIRRQLEFADRHVEKCSKADAVVGRPAGHGKLQLLRAQVQQRGRHGMEVVAGAGQVQLEGEVPGMQSPTLDHAPHTLRAMVQLEQRQRERAGERRVEAMGQPRCQRPGGQLQYLAQPPQRGFAAGRWRQQARASRSVRDGAAPAGHHLYRLDIAGVGRAGLRQECQRDLVAAGRRIRLAPAEALHRRERGAWYCRRNVAVQERRDRRALERPAQVAVHGDAASVGIAHGRGQQGGVVGGGQHQQRALRAPRQRLDQPREGAAAQRRRPQQQRPAGCAKAQHRCVDVGDGLAAQAGGLLQQFERMGAGRGAVEQDEYVGCHCGGIPGIGSTDDQRRVRPWRLFMPH